MAKKKSTITATQIGPKLKAGASGPHGHFHIRENGIRARCTKHGTNRKPFILIQKKRPATQNREAGLTFCGSSVRIESTGQTYTNATKFGCGATQHFFIAEIQIHRYLLISAIRSNASEYITRSASSCFSIR